VTHPVTGLTATEPRLLEPLAPLVNISGEVDIELEQITSRLQALCDDYPNVAVRASRLAARVSAGQFHLTVVGEFKRGKSTLINALIGRELLPTGVLPLTAVPTEIHFGTPESVAVFDDGRRATIRTDQLGDFVTERGNPANIKGVSRVEVGTAAWNGTSRVVLIDTPGVASAYEHNSAVAYMALAESDAAIFVLSADSPLSESELGILADLGERRQRVFVVINKCDHVNDSELADIEEFVVTHLRRHLASWHGPYCTDARATLRRGPEPQTRGMRGVAALKDGLERLIMGDLASARRQASVAEFGRLARSLDQVLQIQAAAAAMDERTLANQLDRFDHAARTGRRSLDNDRVVLDRDAAILADAAADRLAEAARSAAQKCRPALAQKAQTTPTRRLSFELRDVIEECVQAKFEPLRRQAMAELDTAWGDTAARFAERAQHRVRELTESANDLFDVHLPEVALPPVTAQRERFSYLFVRVESPMAPLGRLLSVVLPSKLARRRVLRSAEQRMVQEFLKHAGRARHDIAQRLDAAKQALVSSMVAEYERTRVSLVGAAEGARSLLALGDEERTAQGRLRLEVRALIGSGDHLAVRIRTDQPGGDISGSHGEPNGEAGGGRAEADGHADKDVPDGFEEAAVFEQAKRLERERREGRVRPAESGADERLGHIGKVAGEGQTSEEAE